MTPSGGSPTPFLDEVLGLLRDERVHTSPVDGGYIGNTPPVSIQGFADDLQQIADRYDPNGWDLGLGPVTKLDGAALVKLIINWGTVQYAAIVDGWLSVDVNVSASQDVKDWYNTTKKERGVK